MGLTFIEIGLSDLLKMFEINYICDKGHPEGGRRKGAFAPPPPPPKKKKKKKKNKKKNIVFAMLIDAFLCIISNSLY